MFLRMGLPLMLIFLTAVAQQPPGNEDTGYLDVEHTHAAWPAPEFLVRDLGSKNDDVRLNALRLLGLNEQQAHAQVWSQSQPSKPFGQAVVTPDRIELKYAALGEDASQQAIVAIEIDQTQMTYVAVAVPAANGWERIAQSDCWCKYEMSQGKDAFGEFVQLHPAPEPGPQVPGHFELVLRESGGGTGIYTQYEGRFRVYRGELRLVMSFVSRQRRCDPTGPAPHWCDVERRWFYTTGFGNVMGGALVTARGRFPSDNVPEVQWSIRDLELRALGIATCVNYTWNAQTFQYEPASVSDPCKPRVQ